MRNIKVVDVTWIPSDLRGLSNVCIDSDSHHAYGVNSNQELVKVNISGDHDIQVCIVSR